jgi:hypothetical protein
LIPEGPNDLFFVGDAHQRIYGQPVVMAQCGIAHPRAGGAAAHQLPHDRADTPLVDGAAGGRRGR